MLNELTTVLTGQPFAEFFTQPDGTPGAYDPRFPNDSYFLQTRARDQQYAWFGEGSYAFSDAFKATVGLQYSKTDYSFETLTGGAPTYASPQSTAADKKENFFTPKVSLTYQTDPRNLYYFTYAKGFRPGGGNNPVLYSACAQDFRNFGISGAPATYNSDSVSSFEVGAKNNIDNRMKIASSLYYIGWNSIQQTVVPPICQISFISNLGQAVSKGADIQAEVAVTDGLTFELTAGYTDARYTADSRLTSVEVTPLVAKGDGIVGRSGQPGAPVSASAGLEYRFKAFGLDSFVRGDDEYQARPRLIGATQDANTLQYDPGRYTLASSRPAVPHRGFGLRLESLRGAPTRRFDSCTVVPMACAMRNTSD